MKNVRYVEYCKTILLKSRKRFDAIKIQNRLFRSFLGDSDDDSKSKAITKFRMIWAISIFGWW